MTRLLISTALLGLLAFAGAASAQPDEQRRQDRGGRTAPAAQAAPAAPQAGPANAPRGNSSGGGFANFGNAARVAPPAAAPNNARGNGGENRQGRALNNNPAPSTAMRGPAPNNGNDRGGFANRSGGSNRDFSRYQRNFSASQRFRAPSYRRPNGWYARRWTFGEILPSMFWAPDYWLNDYRAYDLPPPPPGTVWVRDGDDALLIDRYSGEIIEVEYSVFY